MTGLCRRFDARSWLVRGFITWIAAWEYSGLITGRGTRFLAWVHTGKQTGLITGHLTRFLDWAHCWAYDRADPWASY